MSIRGSGDTGWSIDPFAVEAGVSVAGAWARLLGSTAALAGLAVFLPAPWNWFRPAAVGEDPVQLAALTAGAGLVWALLGWAVLVGLATLAARLPGGVGRMGRALLRRIVPGAARRMLLIAVGVSLLGGTGSGLASMWSSTGPNLPLATTAVQQDDSGPALVWATGGVPPTPDQPMPAPLPQGLHGPGPAFAAPPTEPTPGPIDLDWPEPDGPVPATQPAPAKTTSVSEVVVVRGDTLWSIAARHLPADASPAQIDAAWRAWYQANRTVIGNDPDLILPGQRLLAPSARTS